MIKPGKYQHYKGAFYKVIGMVKHSETLEDLVLYQKLYDDYGMWVRPAGMFAEKVEIEGRLVARFAFISDSPDNEGVGRP